MLVDKRVWLPRCGVAITYFLVVIVWRKSARTVLARCLPNKCDFLRFFEAHISEFERKIRTRYMKCLNFKIPEECFKQEWAKCALKKALVGGMMNKVLVNNRCSA